MTDLSRTQLDRVHAAAALLVPGSAESPAPGDLPDFDDLVRKAAVAMDDGDGGGVLAAIDALPADMSWEQLAAWAEHEPAAFDVLSLLVVGAYFMSPAVLASLRLPTAPRRPAKPEQVVDELSSGVLDAVIERGCPVRTLDEVNRKVVAG